MERLLSTQGRILFCSSSWWCPSRAAPWQPVQSHRRKMRHCKPLQFNCQNQSLHMKQISLSPYHDRVPLHPLPPDNKTLCLAETEADRTLEPCADSPTDSTSQPSSCTNPEASPPTSPPHLLLHQQHRPRRPCIPPFVERVGFNGAEFNGVQKAEVGSQCKPTAAAGKHRVAAGVWQCHHPHDGRRGLGALLSSAIPRHRAGARQETPLIAKPERRC